MKQLIGLLFIFAFSVISFGQTTNNNVWIGKYAHTNDAGKEYFMLEIFRDGDKIKGKYKEMISDQTTNKFTVNITVKGDSASFFADECLPLTKAEENDGGINNCGEDGGYKKGDLVLKLKRIAKGSKATISTIGGLIPDSGMFAGKIDFVKTNKFYELF